MRNLIKLTFAAMIAAFLLTSMPTVCSAAETKLTVNVEISQPADFWNCAFLPRESSPSKAAAVVAEWSIGQVSRQAKTEPIIFQGKSTGKLVISTEKGALINLQIGVVNPKNEKLGFLNLQIRNNGQTEMVTIAPPETIQPVMTWGG